MSVQTETVVQTWQRNGGNVTATSNELGVGRASIYYHLKKAKVDTTKKMADGTVSGVQPVPCVLPKKAQVKRYILTSAQNNTYVHTPAWEALQALAKHYDAQIMVGTFTYNKNAYGKMSVKRGTANQEANLWYDPVVEPFIVDERHSLAKSLQWCGEMNILPTAVNPLAGFDAYTGRDSSIFPQSKFAMRSVPSGRYEGTKFMYTTGTVTQRNYIQKREGLKAEFHHCYGGLLVEVDDAGCWWVRQLNSTKDGVIYDLDICVRDNKITKHSGIEAITWGDSHCLLLDEESHGCTRSMLDALKPKAQFVHDVMLGSVTNHWSRKSLHERFRRYVKAGGWADLRKEIKICVDFLKDIYREGCRTYIVDSNHDRPWMEKWLDTNGREDPKNVRLWFELNAAFYAAMEAEPYAKNFHVIEHAFQMLGLDPKQGTFLREDGSVKITKADIECGMHGHLGPDGARGSVFNLGKMARKANIGHCHKAGIYDGLYACGVSCETGSDAWYMRGPSSWSHSHIVTYPSGKRTIVTVWKGKYRA
ncbi:MAG: hypothetical protein GY934_13540 [Gammaproteobacteria bacterium]|nr:hypothetical protein [Gammaproteobacteria bacterium]